MMCQCVIRAGKLLVLGRQKYTVTHVGALYAVIVQVIHIILNISE